jgi:hypothetical protein
MRPATDVQPEDRGVTAFVCGRRWCQKEGQEHDWSGPAVEFDGGASVTCARCGIDAMTDSLMRLP